MAEDEDDMEMKGQETSSLLKSSEDTYGGKRRNHKSLILVLSAVLVFFIVASIVLAALFAYHVVKEEETTECDVCTTPTCLEATSFLLQGLDTRVDPCEDFYQYSCGNWEDNNVIPEGFGRYSTFGQLGTSNSITLKYALEEPVPEGDASAVSKAKLMYARCMDVDKLNSLGPDPLKEIVVRTGGWALINVSESLPKWSLEGNLSHEHYFGSDAFFSFGIEADDFNSSVVTIKVCR